MELDIYNDMLSSFSDTLKKTSEDINKFDSNKYMTLCEKEVVNLDKVKNDFIRKMKLSAIPLSCDVLFKSSQNDFFIIEFKNGKIEAKKNYEVKVKIFESLLMLSEKFSQTTAFIRNNFSFVFVYNENVEHGEKQFKDTGLNEIEKTVFDLAHLRNVRFGLHRFKKLYFKEVYTYSKKEFESEFVAKYCI